jgi:hypothetical protein
LSEYLDSYIDDCFTLYYENDRKIGDIFISKLPLTTDGRRPSKSSVLGWERTHGWVERADALDAEVSRKADTEIINRRMKMFEKHEFVGTQLMEKGLAYLEENGITSDASAIRAIDLGITTRIASTGMAETYVKISKMSNDALSEELQKLLGFKNDEIIDVDVIEDESSP